VSRRLLWVLLIGLGTALLLLIVRHQDGTVAGLESRDFASLATKIALLIVGGSIVLMLFRDRFTDALEAALLWVVIALLLAVGYTYRADLRDISEHVLAEFVPGRAASHGRMVEIARGRGGDFQITTQINGAKVAMVLDTGATTVVLTQDAAKAAGLPLEILAYTVNIETANGRARAASVTLDRMAVGNLVERSVPALIAQPGQLKTSLLGMSFLDRLESWEVRADRLMMRGYP